MWKSEREVRMVLADMSAMMGVWQTSRMVVVYGVRRSRL